MTQLTLRQHPRPTISPIVSSSIAHPPSPRPFESRHSTTHVRDIDPYGRSIGTDMQHALALSSATRCQQPRSHLAPSSMRGRHVRILVLLPTGCYSYLYKTRTTMVAILGLDLPLSPLSGLQGVLDASHLTLVYIVPPIRPQRRTTFLHPFRRTAIFDDDLSPLQSPSDFLFLQRERKRDLPNL